MENTRIRCKLGIVSKTKVSLFAVKLLARLINKNHLKNEGVLIAIRI